MAALSARGRLITEALDFLREVTSTFMPLPVQAATGTVEAIAAASLHQVPPPPHFLPLVNAVVLRLPTNK